MSISVVCCISSRLPGFVGSAPLTGNLGVKFPSGRVGVCPVRTLCFTVQCTSRAFLCCREKYRKLKGKLAAQGKESVEESEEVVRKHEQEFKDMLKEAQM